MYRSTAVVILNFNDELNPTGDSDDCDTVPSAVVYPAVSVLKRSIVLYSVLPRMLKY